ncbi:MAG: beta-glucosidase, partial [Thermoproteota archaeon]
YDLFDMKPANERLINETLEIRVSEGRDKILIYTPFNTDIKLKTSESYNKWEGIDLRARRIFKPEVEREENCFTIRMTEFNSDLLIIGGRKLK